MKKTSTKIRYGSFGLSLALLFVLIFKIVSLDKLIQSFAKLFGFDCLYYFSLVDFVLVSAIPVFALIMASQKEKVTLKTILKYNLLFAGLECIVFFGTLLFLSNFGPMANNPLIPNRLILEPYPLSSTFIIVLGIIISFVTVLIGRNYRAKRIVCQENKNIIQ